MSVTKEIIQPCYELDISSDYNLMVEGALQSMGYSPEADGVPALEQIQAGIAQAGIAGWLLERADQGANDTLVISRTVGGEHGIGVAKTIHNLDPKAFADKFVWSLLWGDAQGNNSPHGNMSAVHDNAGEQGIQTKWDTAILLGDAIDPATDKNAYDPGLAYTGKTVSEQRLAFAEEAAELQKRGITIVTATLGAMATDYAARREQGIQQCAGFTRLPHYHEQAVAGDAYVPSVGDVGRLRFDGASVGDAWRNNGVRRLVRVPISPLEN